jgi:uncharacterized membrane protein
MSSPHDHDPSTTTRGASRDSSTLARFTPDSDRWRRRIAGVAALAAPLALYGAYAVASGVKSGTIYNLLVAVVGLLALVLPALAVTVWFAPTHAGTGATADGDADAVETLKRRYAAGEIDRAEFERRLDGVVDTGSARRDAASAKERTASTRSDERRSGERTESVR